MIGTAATGRAATFGALHATIDAQVPRVSIRDMGRLPTQARIDVTVLLKYRHASELESFDRNAADPDSPVYGQFLSPAQFDATFAPASADYDRVIATLVAAGFTIGASPSRSIIEAAAPANVVERFFGTELHAVKQADVVGMRYANVRPATFPAAVRAVTFGVTGLNNLVVAKTDLQRGLARTDAALRAPVEGPDAGLGPFAFASAYKFPVQYAKPSGGTYDGTGHGAGIAIDSDLAAPGDLAGFLKYFGIKQTGPALKRVFIDGGPVPRVSFDAGETNLDVETIVSLAPGAATYLYMMPDLSTQHIIDTYAKVVADDKVDVLNSSFGGCEVADNLAELSEHVAQQAAAEGITFAASSGDGGATLCYGSPRHLGVSSPASAPHFTAVGGTSLVVSEAGAYRFEFAWHGSGGGVSSVFPLPAYQKGVPHIIGAGRNVPDVSFDADPGDGASIYYYGRFDGPIGGTSLASPIFTAFLTERNEVTGKRSGAVNSALYSAFKKRGYGTLYRDITLGGNDNYGAGYFAAPGFDDVTGIGSMIGTPNAK